MAWQTQRGGPGVAAVEADRAPGAVVVRAAAHGAAPSLQTSKKCCAEVRINLKNLFQGAAVGQRELCFCSPWLFWCGLRLGFIASSRVKKVLSCCLANSSNEPRRA